VPQWPYHTSMRPSAAFIKGFDGVATAEDVAGGFQVPTGAFANKSCGGFGFEEEGTVTEAFVSNDTALGFEGVFADVVPAAVGGVVSDMVDKVERRHSDPSWSNSSVPVDSQARQWQPSGAPHEMHA